MGIVSKSKRKWAQTLNFIAHSLFKDFDQKILIFDQRAIPKWPWLLNANTYNHEVLPKCVIYAYVECKKLSWVYMHAPLQCQTKYRWWCKFASPPQKENKVKEFGGPHNFLISFQNFNISIESILSLPYRYHVR